MRDYVHDTLVRTQNVSLETPAFATTKTGAVEVLALEVPVTYTVEFDFLPGETVKVVEGFLLPVAWLREDGYLTDLTFQGGQSYGIGIREAASERDGSGTGPDAVAGVVDRGEAVQGEGRGGTEMFHDHDKELWWKVVERAQLISQSGGLCGKRTSLARHCGWDLVVYLCLKEHSTS